MSEKKKTRLFFGKYANAMVNALRHLLLHNGWLKALAILISIMLWAGLISQDESITRDKTFQNVAVTVTGSDALKSNSMIVVSDLSELLNDVCITAAVPQKQYERAEASVYNVRLDLSRIKGTGEQEVKLQSTNSSTYGKVVSTNPASIKVLVEDYAVRQRIPVSISPLENVPEGWYVSTPSVDPALIAVSGPRSIVQNISRAKAQISADDIEWKEGQIVTSSSIQLYNSKQELVESPLISMTSSNLTIDSVLIELNILPMMTFSTGDLIQTTGTVADGYCIRNIRISPETVTVAARQEVLEQMTDLSLERNTINVKNLKETTPFQLKVQKPSEDSILSNETITVTVEIEEEEP
jgi:YbbR domain-containing protein